MTSPDYVILPDDGRHTDQINQLALNAFGPGMYARTAFRLREGAEPVPEYSFRALCNDKLVGSVQLTRIAIGEKPALLLGPLVVTPDLKNKGIGAALMMQSVNAAKDAGEALIILVGDLPYYEKFGFARVPEGQITLPGPVDPWRVIEIEHRVGPAA